VSAGQFNRRTFLKTTGAASAGVIVATGLPTPVRAAPADAAQDVAFSSDGNPFITNIYTADPDAFVALLSRGDATGARGVLDADFVGEVNDLHDDGDLTDAQAAELVASAALIGSTIQQSIS